MLAASGRLGTASKPVFEINPTHPLIRALASQIEAPDKEKFEDIIWLLFDEARVMEGERPADVVRRPADTGVAQRRLSVGTVNSDLVHAPRWILGRRSRVERRSARSSARCAGRASTHRKLMAACCSVRRSASITRVLSVIQSVRWGRGPCVFPPSWRGGCGGSRCREVIGHREFWQARFKIAGMCLIRVPKPKR